MSSFADDLKKFSVKAEELVLETFRDSVDTSFDSIVNGSALTGAPGQPVQSGNLKASWQKSFESQAEASITSNAEYAPAIEEGVGPHGSLTLRSSVGGFHSIKMTVAAWQKIVSDAVKKVGNR